MNRKDRIRIATALLALFLTLAVCTIFSDMPSNEPYEASERVVVERQESLEDYKVDSVPFVESSYTEEELNILALIIYQEAGADYVCDDTRLKVGNVFLNRVESPLFPNTFEEVATAKRQYGTLYWTGIEWPERSYCPEERHAVRRAFDIAEELLRGKRVLPENVIWQAEFTQGDGIYCYQDNIYFCYTEVE